MPKAFDDMVNAIKKSLRKQNPNMKEDTLNSKSYAMATTQWKKSHGGKAPSRENLDDWRVIEYFMPITEANIGNESKDFLIRGVAINETTTLNNVKYVAEELSKAASSFRNVPILLDHENKVKNIVGRTTENVIFNDSMRRIDFEAKIMDGDIKEMIKDGRIGSVSIGARVEDLIEEEDGSMKAVGIKGMEISLVAVPGDSHANLAQAIQNSFHLKEMMMNGREVNLLDSNDDIVDDDTNKKENSTMSEEEVKNESSEESQESQETSETEETPVESTGEEKSEEVPETPKEETAETTEKSSATNVNVKVDTSEMADIKKQISELKELFVEKKKLQEKMDKKVKEDNTKGEVSENVEESLDKLNNHILEKSKQGFALYRDYSQEGVNTKLKRLVRG